MTEIKSVQFRQCRIRMVAWLILMVSFGTSSCEWDTQLKITGGSPPIFNLSGSGTVGFVRVRGPQRRREADGESAYLYWFIEAIDNPEYIEKLKAITYGRVPVGYKQIYPEQGEAPGLVEGERYYIYVSTAEAKGAGKYFRVRDGKVVDVTDY